MFIDIILSKLVVITFILAFWSFIIILLIQVKKEEKISKLDSMLNQLMWPLVIFWSIIITIFIILLIRN